METAQFAVAQPSILFTNNPIMLNQLKIQPPASIAAVRVHKCIFASHVFQAFIVATCHSLLLEMEQYLL